MLPLRGFLICPTCGRMLTGSASKGRHQHYHYYHCTSSCGKRYKADVANDLFVTEIKKYVPRPVIKDLYKTAVRHVFKALSKDSNTEKKRLLTAIEALSDQIAEARRLLFSKEIEPTDYRESKAYYEKQIIELEAKLSGLPANNFQNIDPLLDKALENLCQLDKLYENGTMEQKRKIIGSIYPEKLVFDGEHYRATRVNEAIRVTFAIDEAFRQKENGTNLSFEDLSHQVIPLGSLKSRRNPL